MSKPSSKSIALRAIPSVDELLRSDVAKDLRVSAGLRRITAIARDITRELRAEIESEELQQTGMGQNARQELLAEAVRRFERACRQDLLGGMRRVINATGVILHTNLGRAPLSEAAAKAIIDEAVGYCTLEYDAITGSRGGRGARVEQLLSELTGAEDALVVNNGAAAALLVLTLLGAGGETIISRGELVEIGGDFRVPDVMANSGTLMVEVGTTNRTRLDDYRRVITGATRLIMRVHPSNYRIIGFTSSPTLSELASLAHEAGLFLYEDAGSGVLIDLSPYGVRDEPIIRESLANGADIVSFSGDKLLGSAQAGMIVGRRDIVARLRKHSLYRALRVDKLRLAALESSLDAYRRDAALKEIPALVMLSLTAAETLERAKALVARLSDGNKQTDLTIEITEGESAVGGGSGPNTHPPTTLLTLRHKRLSPDEIQRHLRLSDPPVIARIAEGKVLLDLRTVPLKDESLLLSAIGSMA